MRPALRQILFGPPGWVRALSPGAVPSLALDFANARYWNGQVRGAPDAIPGWSFSRTGVEYALNSAGLLVPFSSGTPAITDLGLQVWEARTNLLLQSAFAASWSASHATLTPNVVTGPDGTLTAATLIEASDTSQSHDASQTITKAASALAYTVTVLAKPSGRRLVLIAAGPGGTNGVYTVIDLAGAQVGVAPTAFGAGFTAGSAVQPVLLANGFYRCELRLTSDTATSLTVTYRLDNGTGTAALSQSYNGNGSSGVTLAKAKLEQAAFAGPEIDTLAASTTRGAASASVGGLSLPASGTLYVEGVWDHTASQNESFAGFSDGTLNNRVEIFRVSGGGVQSRYVVGGVATNPGNIATGGGSGTSKVAITWSSGRAQSVANGTLATAAAPASLPVVTALHIGESSTAGVPSDGMLRRVVLYPAMSDAQLQALTS